MEALYTYILMSCQLTDFVLKTVVHTNNQVFIIGISYDDVELFKFIMRPEKKCVYSNDMQTTEEA